MANQNYANHTQIVPAFLALLGILLLTVIGSGVNLYQSIGDHQRLYSAALILVLSACTLALALHARAFPLKAQDRAIRAEENLRHFTLTGKLLDPRLKPLQIVALRFASDGEFRRPRHPRRQGEPGAQGHQAGDQDLARRRVPGLMPCAY